MRVTIAGVGRGGVAGALQTLRAHARVGTLLAGATEAAGPRVEG
jgi:hypothetical protein